MKFKKTVINCLTKIGMRRFIRAFSEYKEKRKYYKLIKDAKKENKIYLIFTPTHNNMGDVAIALSEIKLFKELNVKYFEIPGDELFILQKNKKLSLMNGGTIVLCGGGYLGTLWFGCEKLVRDIISYNKKSKIYIMPNTVYYENSSYGNIEFQKSLKIYNKHKNLKIYTREEISFNAVRNYYNNVELMPDMVLFLNKSKQNSLRKGCLICLRSDIEKTLSYADKEIIISQVKKLFNNINYGDMYSEKMYIAPSEREEALEKKLNEFMTSELVITDRLHGMIFSAITGTPCIVVNSKSHKVEGCYKWLSRIEYIKFCNNINDFDKILKIIPKGNFIYNNSDLLYYYEKIKEEFQQYA